MAKTMSMGMTMVISISMALTVGMSMKMCKRMMMRMWMTIRMDQCWQRMEMTNKIITYLRMTIIRSKRIRVRVGMVMSINMR